MTQDEVNLIYDYLHENYEYRNGDLIGIKTSRGRAPIGRAIGSFTQNRTVGTPIIMYSLTINKKRYSMQLKHLIYLFHNKAWSKNIFLIDGNPTNCQIQNLKPVNTINQFILQKENYSNKSGATPYSYNGNTRFRVRLSTDNGRFTIGSYDNESIAKKCYSYAKKLTVNDQLSNEDIKQMTLERFPSNKHKKVNSKGVSQAKGNRFKAIYIKNGYRKHIGTYDTEMQAHEAYLKAKVELENT